MIRHPRAGAVCLLFFILGPVFPAVGTAVAAGALPETVSYASIVLGAVFFTAVIAAGLPISRRSSAGGGRCGASFTARVTDVRLNSAVSISGRHPCVVKCR